MPIELSTLDSPAPQVLATVVEDEYPSLEIEGHCDKPFTYKYNNMPFGTEDESDFDFPWTTISGTTIKTKTKVAGTQAAPKKFRRIGMCCECHIEMFDDGKTKFYRSGEIHNGERPFFYCEKCAPKFSECTSCHHSFRTNSLAFGYCPTCVEQAPARLIQHYHSKADKAGKMGKTLDQIYFGVELEYESVGNYGLDTIKIHNLVKEFAILKKDSSIKQGFEIVSRPATMDVHAEVWTPLFEKLPETVSIDVLNDKGVPSSGMHVHVSRVRLSDLQIGKMLTFIHNPKNEAYITAIAGRPSSYHNDFTEAVKIGEGRDGGGARKNKDRHTALNLINPNTIEFRIFRSTKSRAIFLKNIEFCRALVKFTDWARVSVQAARSFEAFYAYVKELRKEYPFLWEFLSQDKAFAPLRGGLLTEPTRKVKRIN